MGAEAYDQETGAAEGVLGVDRVGLMLLDEHDRLQVVGASDPASCQRARGRVVGNLKLVRSRPGAWSDQQLRACQAYADVIGVLLTLSAPGPGTADSSA